MTELTSNQSQSSVPKEVGFFEGISASWTPYRVANTVFILLFLGADISLFLFGKEATGNIVLALILTLLSGVGALIWKRQRDNKDSNKEQRDIALVMIILHAVSAVIFLGGNFAQGGWDALANNVMIDGQLASEMVDYYVVVQKIYIWSIVVMIIADMIALFVFMEKDTAKEHERELSKIARADEKARLEAISLEKAAAARYYREFSGQLADIAGMEFAKERIQQEFQNLSPQLLANKLAEMETKIAEKTGAIPIANNSANSPDGSQTAPFTQPSQQPVTK